jgi:alpha-L-arabinofuranosidase
MDAYVQEILDLVEYANGPADSKWGKVRADAGHPEPFNLKYIGIGNEDQISDRFEERFRMIYERLRKAHPEITMIGTAGPFCEGTDYEEGWKIARELDVSVVDEHYYQPPGWFIHNQDFYDHYPRGGSKVYLGEYASRGNTLYHALAEAAYMTALERNGDVVCMASYAPLLAREGHTQWNPDLIYFNGKEVKPTVNYQVQKLFGLNAGEQYLEGGLTVTPGQDAVRKRLAYSVVQRGDELIIKLVNLLPVKANVRIEPGKTAGMPGGTRTVLTGMPGDRNPVPQVFPFATDGDFRAELPPYSLTVIRTKIAKPSAGKE